MQAQEHQALVNQHMHSNKNVTPRKRAGSFAATPCFHFHHCQWEGAEDLPGRVLAEIRPLLLLLQRIGWWWWLKSGQWIDGELNAPGWPVLLPSHISGLTRDVVNPADRVSKQHQ